MRAFCDIDDEFYAAFFQRLCFNLRDIDIGKASVLVEGADGGAIFFDLRWCEASAFVEEGENIQRFCLHHGPEVFGEDRVIAIENDLFDNEFGTFRDGKNHASAVFSGDFLHAILHIHIGVIPILIEGQDFLAVLLDFFVIYDIARFHSEVAAHSVERDVLGAFDDDLLHHGAALEEHGDFHAIAERFGKDSHIGNAAGLVKSAHILLGGPLAVGLADLRGEVRQNAIFGNTRSTDCLDRDVFNNRSGRLFCGLCVKVWSGRCEGEGKQQGNEEVFGVSENSHGVGGGAHIGDAEARKY